MEVKWCEIWSTLKFVILKKIIYQQCIVEYSLAIPGTNAAVKIIVFTINVLHFVQMKIIVF